MVPEHSILTSHTHARAHTIQNERENSPNTKQIRKPSIQVLELLLLTIRLNFRKCVVSGYASASHHSC